MSLRVCEWLQSHSLTNRESGFSLRARVREMSMAARETIRVGTRGSELALWQANATEQLLRAAFPEVEVIRCVIKTTGDRRTDVALSEVAKATARSAGV